MTALETAVIRLLAFAMAVIALATAPAHAADSPNTGMAEPLALVNALDRFLAGIPLLNLRGLASKPANASGNVRIDFNDGSIVSRVKGLPAGSSL